MSHTAKAVFFIHKGPVKIMQRVKIAHSCLQPMSNPVPLNYFKPAYILLHKEFFETTFLNWRNKPF